MPYTPAIKVHAGKLVFLSGVTAAQVYHSHPHVPEEFDHIPDDAERQAEMTMENPVTVLEAAGGRLTDIVQSVQGLVSSDSGEPRRRVVGDPAPPPLFYGHEQGVLESVFGDVQVAGEADEGGTDLATLNPQRLVEGYSFPLKSMQGRTSTEPCHAPGIWAAHFSASSRSAASSR